MSWIGTKVRPAAPSLRSGEGASPPKVHCHRNSEVRNLTIRATADFAVPTTIGIAGWRLLRRNALARLTSKRQIDMSPHKMLKVPPEGLVTRHIFLDTSEYRSQNHDTTAKLLSNIGNLSARRKIQLHICEITRFEIYRQIREKYEGMYAKIRSYSSKLQVDYNKSGLNFDFRMPKNADDISGQWMLHFNNWLLRLSAIEHKALDIPIAAVFSKYLDRKPPFHNDGSKEFPDALVSMALEKWCFDEKSECTL